MLFPFPQDTSKNYTLDCKNDEITEILVYSNSVEHFFGLPLELTESQSVRRKNTAKAENSTQKCKNEACDVMPSFHQPIPVEGVHDNQETGNSQQKGNYTKHIVHSKTQFPMVTEIST